jgi:hypothetical protein
MIQKLREYLSYNPATGHLIWRRDKGPAKAGERAGSPTPRHNRGGYRTLKFDQKSLKEHRVIWAIHHGTWPQGEIDHINGMRDDNRLANLRDVPSEVNAINRQISAANTSGATGVSRKGRRWQAYICHRRKQMHLGYFDTFEDAKAAREAKARELGFHITT